MALAQIWGPLSGWDANSKSTCYGQKETQRKVDKSTWGSGWQKEVTVRVGGKGIWESTVTETNWWWQPF